MVDKSTTYRCGKCHKPYRTYRDAEGCELGHIVTEAANGFRDDLARILGKDTEAAPR